MIDRIIFLLIALGLLWNALNPWIMPAPATADKAMGGEIVEVDEGAFEQLDTIPVKVAR